MRRGRVGRYRPGYINGDRGCVAVQHDGRGSEIEVLRFPCSGQIAVTRSRQIEARRAPSTCTSHEGAWSALLLRHHSTEQPHANYRHAVWIEAASTRRI